ncbi:hypothetical protein FQZ97_998030 [compost metagenome]
MTRGWWPLMPSIMATDSMAASSCRQRMTRSACAMRSRLASGSLRRSGAMLSNSIAGMPCKRSRICRPVVPASPSMKILAMTLGALSVLVQRCVNIIMHYADAIAPILVRRSMIHSRVAVSSARAPAVRCSVG